MATEKDVYEDLLKQGFSKREIHSALHKWVLLYAKKKDDKTLIESPHNKTDFHSLKNTHLLSSLKGKALCLLKTLFAKKPKNPI